MHGAWGGPPASTMPARLQGIAKAKNASEIPLDKIGPDPNQPREEFEEEGLGRLAESMRTRGQLQPIRVRWDEGRAEYVIICGERRWRAATLAGLKAMSCVIEERPLDAGELLALQLVENALREDLKPIEQARAYKALMDRNGWTATQVGRELAIDQSSVSRALALLALPPAVQDLVERETLSPATAYEVSKLDDPEAQAEVAARVVAEGLSRSETIEAVRQAAGRSGGKARGNAKGRGAKSRKVTRRAFRTPTGRVTVENGRGLDASAILAAVEDVTRQVRAALDEGRGGAAA